MPIQHSWNAAIHKSNTVPTFVPKTGCGSVTLPTTTQMEDRATNQDDPYIIILPVQSSDATQGINEHVHEHTHTVPCGVCTQHKVPLLLEEVPALLATSAHLAETGIAIEAAYAADEVEPLNDLSGPTQHTASSSASTAGSINFSGGSTAGGQEESAVVGADGWISKQCSHTSALPPVLPSETAAAKQLAGISRAGAVNQPPLQISSRVSGGNNEGPSLGTQSHADPAPDAEAPASPRASNASAAMRAALSQADLPAPASLAVGNKTSLATHASNSKPGHTSDHAPGHAPNHGLKHGACTMHLTSLPSLPDLHELEPVVEELADMVTAAQLLPHPPSMQALAGGPAAAAEGIGKAATNPATDAAAACMGCENKGSAEGTAPLRGASPPASPDLDQDTAMIGYEPLPGGPPVEQQQQQQQPLSSELIQRGFDAVAAHGVLMDDDTEGEPAQAQQYNRTAVRDTSAQAGEDAMQAVLDDPAFVRMDSVSGECIGGFEEGTARDGVGGRDGIGGPDSKGGSAQAGEAAEACGVSPLLQGGPLSA